jgi:uncharacterized damage-inducible protein DinB
MSTSSFAVETPVRIARLRCTVEQITALLAAASPATIARRPALDAWSVTEILCHLRDIEEAYGDRIRFVLANEEPALSQIAPERWVEERQYRRHEADAALAAFRARRHDTLALIETLDAGQWERAGRHPSRGRLTIRKIVHSLAKHDSEHCEQIARALAGQP